jgi:hypothetical protein
MFLLIYVRLVDQGLPLMCHIDFRFIPTEDQRFVITAVRCYMVYTDRVSSAKVGMPK